MPKKSKMHEALVDNKELLLAYAMAGYKDEAEKILQIGPDNLVKKLRQYAFLEYAARGGHFNWIKQYYPLNTISFGHIIIGAACGDHESFIFDTLENLDKIFESECSIMNPSEAAEFILNNRMKIIKAAIAGAAQYARFDLLDKLLLMGDKLIDQIECDRDYRKKELRSDAHETLERQKYVPKDTRFKKCKKI